MAKPRGSGRLKMTWMNVIKIDLKKWSLFEDLGQDISKWRKRIHVADLNRIRRKEFM